MTPRSLTATQLGATQGEEPAAAADGLSGAAEAAPVTCAECGGRLDTGLVATQGEELVNDAGSRSAARIAAMHCPTCIRRAVILSVVARSVAGPRSGCQANASPEQSAPRP